MEMEGNLRDEPEHLHLIGIRNFHSVLSSLKHTLQDLGPAVTAKNFIPFGGGTRMCGGAEFSKAFMAIFLHVLVSNYR